MLKEAGLRNEAEPESVALESSERLVGAERPASSEVPGTGSKSWETLGAGSEPPGAGPEAPGAGPEALGTGSEALGTGSEAPGTGSEAPGAGSEGSEAPGGARREHRRHSVELDVTLTSEHNFYAGFVENLSVSGIFIATHQLKPVGERIECCVHLPGCEQPIRGTGEVRWLRVYSETSNVPPGMGMRFEQLEPEALRAIEAFLARREPLFYDED